MTNEENDRPYGGMYDPNARNKTGKGGVDIGRFWQVIGSIDQRFSDIDEKAMLEVIQKVLVSSIGDKKSLDVTEEYKDAINNIYMDRIEELIDDIKECIKK